MASAVRFVPFDSDDAQGEEWAVNKHATLHESHVRAAAQVSSSQPQHVKWFRRVGKYGCLVI